MSQARPAEANKPDLLIVDDDPLITDTLNFVLGRDFTVYVADSRTRVKSLLRQLDNPPQLALIDLGLPPTPHRPDEGFRLISELIAYSPGIKIVVLSGQNDEANARHARTLGAIEFVAKPCEPDNAESAADAGARGPRRPSSARAAEGGLLGKSLLDGKAAPADLAVRERAVPGADRGRIRQRQGAGRARRCTA